MRRYRLTQEASEDILAIYVHGHDLFGERQADTYHDELEAVFGRLADFPEMGRLREELDPPARVFTHKAHVVVYEIRDGDAVILRVRGAREDWQVDNTEAHEDFEP